MRSVLLCSAVSCMSKSHMRHSSDECPWMAVEILPISSINPQLMPLLGLIVIPSGSTVGDDVKQPLCLPHHFRRLNAWCQY